MHRSSLFHWFSCCLQSSNPTPNDSIHSKSNNNSFNTDHYTDQMKEAFFTKLLLHKGLCLCQEISPDAVLPENFRIMNSLTKYPKKNQVFLLKYNSTAGIMASMNTINFSTRNLKKNPKAFQSHLCKVIENRKEEEEFESADMPIIPLKPTNKIKQEFSKLVKGMPDEMVDHLVQRFNKGELVIDVLNGMHSLSLQLAMKGVAVLAVEKSQKHLTVFKHNTGLWDFTDQVMALQADFLEMKLDHIKPDAIIINFKAETIDLLKEKFCLFKHVKPNIRETLRRASSITNQVVLMLPKHVEIDEISLVFKDYFEGCHERNQQALGNSIEIECIMVNNKFEKIVIYFGSISTITPSQEFNFIKSIISEEKDSQSPSLSEYSQNQISSFLRKLTKRFTAHQIASCLLSLETINPHFTQFQAFIEQIKSKLSVSTDEIMEYLLPENSEHETCSFANGQEINMIVEKQPHYEKESDDGGASCHSWEISSTPAFNDVVGLKDHKKKLVLEECKSAELNPKILGDCFSFK